MNLNSLQKTKSLQSNNRRGKGDRKKLTIPSPEKAPEPVEGKVDKCMSNLLKFMRIPDKINGEEIDAAT